jgi:indolepyruvate ferredoxin oxidoreductase beta subunit
MSANIEKELNMKYDILLCGVGGQGVISLANMISTAAIYEGLTIRQSEVHGMAQRGGAVNAQVRMADKSIASDLIPEGTANMIISMEAIEGLRYIKYLSPDGIFITAAEPVKNIADYPELEKVYASIRTLPKNKIIDTASIDK